MSLKTDALTSLEFLERLLYHSQRGEEYPNRAVSELSLKTSVMLIKAFLSSCDKENDE